MLFLDIPAVLVGNLIIVEPTLISREPIDSYALIVFRRGHPPESKSVQTIVPTAPCGDFF